MPRTTLHTRVLAYFAGPFKEFARRYKAAYGHLVRPQHGGCRVVAEAFHEVLGGDMVYCVTYAPGAGYFEGQTRKYEWSVFHHMVRTVDGLFVDSDGAMPLHEVDFKSDFKVIVQTTKPPGPEVRAPKELVRALVKHMDEYL
jgi:hypothetical protein